MTRNFVIAVINLAIAAVIGINAAIALLDGCEIGGGRCSGSSGVLTWMLAIIMPMVAIIGGIMVLKKWRGVTPVSSREIKFATPSGQTGPVETDAEADNAMSARLARTANAAHVPEVASEEVEIAVAGGDIEAGADVRFGAISDAAIMSDETKDVAASVEYASTDWPTVTGVAPGDNFHPDFPTGAEPAQNRVFEQNSPRPDEWADGQDGDRDIPQATEGRAIDWLIDGDEAGFTPLLREDCGFPWVVAGIDHVCAGVARIGHRLIGTDFPAEAAAWRQVVGGLSRSDLLARDDARAFTAWVNGILDVSGDAGLDLVEDALHELGVEAATNAALAARLPADMSDFGEHSVGSSALRMSK